MARCRSPSARVYLSAYRASIIPFTQFGKCVVDFNVVFVYRRPGELCVTSQVQVFFD